MSTSIVNETFYPYPADNVWRALTDPAALGEWLMPNDFKPEIGHKFTFRTDPAPPYFDGIAHCEVVELDPPCVLAYSWRGGPLPNTKVRWLLTPSEGGTLLRLEHSGFDLGDPGQRAAFSRLAGGWGGKIIIRFTAVLEGMA
ncbi:MAG: SRPBCC domain-containing protein [Kutzneria sp.]|nr:SRPBCC domain-containing protein [Kutzneria sp.]MBV9845977.1 SRPBCC domain-containing protein [Kutzneria sp.]